jgi:iron-sulfur cluster assembly accessory protein
MQIEITNEAIQKLVQKQTEEQFSYIRIGVTGGGCAGFQYIFDTDTAKLSYDIELDYGKWKFLIDNNSVPYLDGMTIDYVKEGLNEFFKFHNDKEESSCGCGVSINFKI